MKPTWAIESGPYPWIDGDDSSASLVYHAKERSLWVLALSHETGSVFRYRDGGFERVCGRDAFAHPQALFSHHVAFFDPAIEAPVVMFDDWEGKNVGEIQKLRKAGKLSTLFVSEIAADGVRGRPVGITGQLEDSDTILVRDGELVHLSRPNGGKAVLRVLRSDRFEPIATEVPEALHEDGTLGHCIGAYDRDRRAMVFVCNDHAYAYDGTTWSEIETPPNASYLGRAELALTDPISGSVLYVEEPSPTGAPIHRFDGKRWTQVGTGPTSWKAACVAERRIVFFQAQRTGDEPAALFVAWDGKQLVAEGPQLVQRPALMPGAKPRLWGVTATPAGPVGFAEDGSAWGLANGERTQLAAKPNGYKPRLRVVAAWDPARNATLVLGGTPSEGNASLKDAWTFDGKQLSQVGLKPPFAVVDGGAAFSSALGRVVVAGGLDKWKGKPTQTVEIDGDRTIAFPPAQIGAAGRALRLTADGATGLVVACTYDAAAVYLGGGTWSEVVTAPDGAEELYFDPATRALRTTCASGPVRTVQRCPLGAWLDAQHVAPASAAAPVAAAQAAPIADAMNLVYIGGGSNKFWCAKLSGTKYTAEWGRRGAKTPSSKVFEYDTPAKARAAYERVVRGKLDEGYAVHAGDPRQLAGKTAFGLVLGKTGDDHWGGVPPFFDAGTWPRCSDCDKPLAFVMLLGKDADRLPLTKHDALAVFVCTGDCETYDPRVGNHVALLTSAQCTAKGKPPAEARAIGARRIGYAPRFEAAEEEEIERAPLWNKVGGYPDFIQSEQTVSCRECHQPMRFVAQFTDDLDRSANLNFGDQGCGYVVVCPEEHDAAFFWQCH